LKQDIKEVHYNPLHADTGSRFRCQIQYDPKELKQK
jgi:hypothetical protein